MSTIVATNPVGIYDSAGNQISRQYPLYTGTTAVVAVPWRSDRITTYVWGSATAGVEEQEDLTSSAVPGLVSVADGTFLQATVYDYTNHPQTGTYAGTPNANGATVDFDFHGSFLGFVQLLNSTTGYLPPRFGCRIDGVAHPIDAIPNLLPIYGTQNTSVQIRSLIAANDLPRGVRNGWHHCTLAFQSDVIVDAIWVLEALLLEQNEINQPLAQGSIWPRQNNIALNASTYTTMTPRTTSGLTQGYGFTRVAFVNTTGSAVTVQWRAHMANGTAITNPDVITIQANDTRWIDAPYGRVWTQIIEAMASAASGVFMRGEIAK